MPKGQASENTSRVGGAEEGSTVALPLWGLMAKRRVKGEVPEEGEGRPQVSTDEMSTRKNA